jgi:NAD(P)-dependent dehydrogenase (short-subunit alcohol dehydrogenase family)
MSPQDFTGKVVAISGAASGIALATAQYLYSLGASVSITDVRRSALQEAIATISDSTFKKYELDSANSFANTKEIQGAADGDKAVKDDDPVIESGNERIFAIVTDVRSSEQVERWIRGTVEKFGRLDGAANLAGVVGKHIGVGSILDMTDEDWAFMIGINLSGVFHALRAQIRVLKELVEKGTIKGASIVNAASTAGIEGNPNNLDYSAAKHGVVGMTRCIAKEWGHLNIRCNAVAP